MKRYEHNMVVVGGDICAAFDKVSEDGYEVVCYLGMQPADVGAENQEPKQVFLIRKEILALVEPTPQERKQFDANGLLKLEK